MKIKHSSWFVNNIKRKGEEYKFEILNSTSLTFHFTSTITRKICKLPVNYGMSVTLLFLYRSEEIGKVEAANFKARARASLANKGAPQSQ